MFKIFNERFGFMADGFGDDFTFGSTYEADDFLKTINLNNPEELGYSIVKV